MRLGMLLFASNLNETSHMPNRGEWYLKSKTQMPNDHDFF